MNADASRAAEKKLTPRREDAKINENVVVADRGKMGTER